MLAVEAAYPFYSFSFYIVFALKEDDSFVNKKYNTPTVYTVDI